MKHTRLVILFFIIIFSFMGQLSAYNFRDSIDAAYRVTFSVNNAWEVKKEKASDFGKTYKIHPRGNKRFVMLISILKTPERSLDLAFAREQLEEQGKKLLARSVEKELILHEMKDIDNKNALGYYYRLTDKDPAPDGFLYAIQGMLPKEKSLITFTYLYNYESEKEFQSVCDTLRSIAVSHDASQSKIHSLLFQSSELPDAVLGKDLIAKSIQVQYFFLRPGTYETVLPPLAEKEIQSLETKSDRGAIMFFRYAGEIESAKDFLTRLFYGPAGEPSADHPEEFVLRNDTLVIFCFEKGSALGAEAKKRVMEKMNQR